MVSVKNCVRCGKPEASSFSAYCPTCYKLERAEALKDGFTGRFCIRCGARCSAHRSICQACIDADRPTETQCEICGKWFPSWNGRFKCEDCSAIDGYHLKRYYSDKQLGLRIRRPTKTKQPGENAAEIREVAAEGHAQHKTYGQIVSEKNKTAWKWSDAVLQMKEEKRLENKTGGKR